MTPVWPLFDLRLRTANLELRLPTQDEALALTAEAPVDLETDPSWPAVDGADQPIATSVLQWYWRALGTWKAEHWRLPLAVWFEGRAIGFQEIEAERFNRLRTVDTSSWLVDELRGRGLGQEMRAAVLGLAFDHLGADFAVSSAWASNGSSLGVSSALGYEKNGWVLHEHHDRTDRMQRVVLGRDRWDSSRWPVSIENLAPCLPWFAAT